MDEPTSEDRAAGSDVPARDEAGRLLQHMRAFAESLPQKNGLDDLLWDIARSVGDLFGYEDCVVYLVEPFGVVQSAAFGVKSPALRQIRNRLVLPLGQGIVGTVAATGAAELIADTRQDARYISDEFRGRSELTVPIAYCGKVIGVLDSECSRPNGYTSADRVTFELIAALAAPRIASALAERDLRCALTELERAASQHRDREEQLQRLRLESLGQLAGGIAHDFNNLLTAILGNVGLAQKEVTSGPAVSLLADAVEACNRSRELSKQLLAFATGGGPTLQPGDVPALVQEVVTAVLSGTDTEVEWRIADDLPIAAFDPVQLREALRHLTQNAREAMVGGGRLVVEVSAPPRGLEVCLHDSGPGVPSPLHGRVFDPYFSTKEGGVGLGLSAAYWIARRHGGGLELDSVPTRGARFRLWLPVTAEVRRQRGAERKVDKLRVLLLDDEPAVRQVLVRMLKSLGHEVVAVGDGVACIREFGLAQQQRQPFDIAILDLTLRHGIGWEETFAAVRQMDPRCVAIAISGYHDSPVMSNHREYGLAGCLNKPFTDVDLARTMRAALLGGAESAADA